ncbi:MAG: response regulator transcription factor [Patulibacter minatonensis]
MSIRVLLADDQAMVRTGLAMILQTSAAITVVGEAQDGREAVDRARALRPDVVLMDIQMPVEDGLSATARILGGAAPESRVVMLTTFERDDYLFEALKAGASGFLLKNAPPEQLIHAVEVVAGGDALLAPSLTRRLLAQFSGPVESATRAAYETQLAELTAREREVLVALARGRSNAELADALVVSEGTAKTHVSNVLRKLGVRDRVQAVIVAYESGLVEPGDESAAAASSAI